MPHTTRIGLANARIRTSEQFFKDHDKYSRKLISDSGSDAFNMFTVNGAKALGLDYDNGGIGRIRVRPKADVVILDGANSINKGIASRYDSVVAVTRSTSLVMWTLSSSTVSSEKERRR